MNDEYYDCWIGTIKEELEQTGLPWLIKLLIWIVGQDQWDEWSKSEEGAPETAEEIIQLIMSEGSSDEIAEALGLLNGCDGIFGGRDPNGPNLPCLCPDPHREEES